MGRLESGALSPDAPVSDLEAEFSPVYRAHRQAVSKAVHAATDAVVLDGMNRSYFVVTLDVSRR